MKNTLTKAEAAFWHWQRLAYKDAESDYQVNDLLEEIAGEKYSDYEELDNPIWEIIQRLDEAELDAFIDGCLQI